MSGILIVELCVVGWNDTKRIRLELSLLPPCFLSSIYFFPASSDLPDHS